MKKSLIEQSQNFLSYHREQSGLFDKLAAGQEPRVLFVSCADSRVDPLLIMGGKPGDLFVVRTAGNFVPTYEKNTGEAASIEFALESLPIEDIVVCGHSSCGAVKGLLSFDKLDGLPKVKDWVEQCSGVLKGIDPSDPDLTDNTARKSVVQQIENLKTYPQVQKKLAAHQLTLHGWFFDIKSGSVSEVH